MGKHNQKVDRATRVDIKELEVWFTDFQSKVMNQINNGYTGQVVMSIKNGKIENIRNLEVIGASTLDGLSNIE